MRDKLEEVSSQLYENNAGHMETKMQVVSLEKEVLKLQELLSGEARTPRHNMTPSTPVSNPPSSTTVAGPMLSKTPSSQIDLTGGSPQKSHPQQHQHHEQQ